jgi:hypothetical protein
VKSTVPQALQQARHGVRVTTLVAPELLNHSTETGVSVGVRVALTTIAALTSVCAVSAPSPAAAPYPLATTLATRYTAIGDNRMDAAGSPDLYGNEVIDAVAQFKLDDTGNLYEVHSPQTELPVLTSPTS